MRYGWLWLSQPVDIASGFAALEIMRAIDRPARPVYPPQKPDAFGIWTARAVGLFIGALLVVFFGLLFSVLGI